MNGDDSFSVALASTGITINFSDERSSAPPLAEALLDQMSAAVRQTLAAEGVVSASADVLLVDLGDMATLNAEHMGAQGPTDVLSFPLDDPSEGDAFGFTPHVGDIVICPDRANEQAAEHAGSFEAEMILLAVHAALHLVGHDHAEPAESEQMQTLEANTLATFGIAHPGKHT